LNSTVPIGVLVLSAVTATIDFTPLNSKAKTGLDKHTRVVTLSAVIREQMLRE
jgi:hypothetical protein